MRNLYWAVALAVAAIGANAATAQTNTVPRPANMTPSATGPSSGALKTQAAPTAATRTTGTTTGTTTTGTTTGSTATTTTTVATNGALVSVVPNTTLGVLTPRAGTTAGSTVSGTSSGDVLNDARNRNLSASVDTRNNLSGGLETVPAVITTDGTTIGTGSTTTPAAGVITIDNGSLGMAGGVNANGELVGNVAQAPAPQQQVLAQGAVSQELTALERRELRKRKNVPANKQLLDTIAPRTNVDRTWQMPDDPPSPALSTSPLR